ncbi:transporter substrate-binding domain-containing protein [Mycolicibacterium sphagni]|uniref:Transporter substrate-binding domain-containing protein n=1 Tax=Mycolicibacterium sphagni TaxID=1786 RepID=A0ABX2K0B0_9MYCO|nr:transporter substrate-binding domain-containing protein [Mycolicibacterium sphagni]
MRYLRSSPRIKGNADIAAGGLSITAERERCFDFSQPTLDAGLQILVPHEDHADSTPGLRSFVDLLWSKSMLVWLGPPQRSPSSRPTSCG